MLHKKHYTFISHNLHFLSLIVRIQSQITVKKRQSYDCKINNVILVFKNLRISGKFCTQNKYLNSEEIYVISKKEGEKSQEEIMQ